MLGNQCNLARMPRAVRAGSHNRLQNCMGFIASLKQKRVRTSRTLFSPPIFSPPGCILSAALFSARIFLQGIFKPLGLSRFPKGSPNGSRSQR